MEPDKSFEPASTVIARLGGVSKVASVCEVNISTVQRWRMSKEKGGSDGVIPARYMPRLLQHAAATGAPVSAEDIIPRHQATEARAS